MSLVRLFAHQTNALKLPAIPALTLEEIQQRENQTQFGQPDADYPADWAAACEEAAVQWRALGSEPRVSPNHRQPRL